MSTMKIIIPRTLIVLLWVSVLFFFLYCEKGIETQEITLQKAETIVLDNVLNGSDSGKVVYELPTPMKAGSSVRPKHSIDSVSYTASSDSWFFFIDDYPDFRWAHPCRYVFVFCSTGDYTVYDEDFYPDNFDSLVVVRFR